MRYFPAGVVFLLGKNSSTLLGTNSELTLWKRKMEKSQLPFFWRDMLWSITKTSQAKFRPETVQFVVFFKPRKGTWNWKNPGVKWSLFRRHLLIFWVALYLPKVSVFLETAHLETSPWPSPGPCHGFHIRHGGLSGLMSCNPWVGWVKG